MSGLAKKIRRKQQVKCKKEEHKNEVREAKAKQDALAFKQWQDKHDDSLRKDTADNFITIWFYVMNHDFGYGAVRLHRLYDKVAVLGECVQENWSPMEEWLRALREEAHFNYHCIDTTKYPHDFQIVLHQIDRLNVIFVSGLFVTYGFCGKRLQRCLKAVERLSASLKGNPDKIDELDLVLRKKKIFTDPKEAA